MKKIKYIFILLLLFSIKINAQQQYKSCLDGDMVKWSILYEGIDSDNNSMDIIAYGDTTINGLLYKNIDLEYFFDFEASNTNWKNYIPVLYRNDPYYYIRESEDASKIYIFLMNREYLVSDINLQVGDEFQVPEIWYNYLFQESMLLTVDSIYMKDGLKHVQLNYTFRTWFSGDGEFNKLTFIEGIGPNVGLISVWDVGLYQLVNCFQNQSLFYKSDVTSLPCGYQTFYAIQTVSSDEDYSLRIEDSYIKIHFSMDENRQISIYDISGRLYYKRDFSSTKEIILPAAPFHKGIYLLKLYSKDNNQINIHKIIL